MSLNPVEKLAAEVDAAERAIRTVCGGQNTFNKIALIALVVLPGTLISDKGIVDGPTQTIMPVFSKQGY
jgi:adenine deaminase